MIVGLVLAAGASTRMGPEHNKLLEEVAGRAVVEGPVDALRAAGIERVVVVLGHEAEALRARLADRTGVEPCVHAGWREGMGTSIAAGVRHIHASDPSAAILVSVGDLPGLTPEVVRSVVDAWLVAGRADAICVPVHRGRRGHPVLFGPAHAADLAALSGDRGARDLIAAATLRGAVIEVEIADHAIVEDVDSLADLARWRRGS